MDDRDLIASSYTNAAALADTVLILIDSMRTGTSRLSLAQQRSLGSLRDLLRGSANGAKSLARDDLSPTGERSLSADLADYDVVTKVKGDLEYKRLQTWTTRTASVVESLQSEGYSDLSEKDRRWIQDELEPFLDELAQLDGPSLYEGEPEIQQQDIAAA
jgi:hypothetical protein